MGPKVTLDHCVVHVSDWARSNDFYARVMGAEVVARGKGFAYRFGEQQLNLHGPGVDPRPGRARSGAAGQQRSVLRVAGADRGAAAHLRDCGVAIELGPVERAGAKGTGMSVYFRDPDGSLLEFISYAGMTDNTLI